MALALVSLDDGALRAGRDHDKRPRMRVGQAPGLPRHHVINLDRLYHYRSAGDPNKRYVSQERRVERDKGVLGGVSAKVFPVDFGEAGDWHVAGQAESLPHKVRARDRRHISVSPLLVAGGWKPQHGETREGAVAQFLQPRLRRFLLGELLQPIADLFRHRRHALPTASASSWIPSAA